MKLPNTKTIKFKEFLDVQKRLLRNSIRFLSNATQRELYQNGFKNKKEVENLLNYQIANLKWILKQEKYLRWQHKQMQSPEK